MDVNPFSIVIFYLVKTVKVKQNMSLQGYVLTLSIREVNCLLQRGVGFRAWEDEAGAPLTWRGKFRGWPCDSQYQGALWLHNEVGRVVCGVIVGQEVPSYIPVSENFGLIQILHQCCYVTKKCLSTCYEYYVMSWTSITHFKVMKKLTWFLSV